MLKLFLTLEWKSFTRAASFKSNLFIKIISALAILYFIALFLLFGIGIYFILEEQNMPPFATVNRFLIAYLTLDLVVRYFLQKLPVMNIRPLLYLNLSKNSIVGYAMGKSILSFFNWLHFFLLVPFSVVLIMEADYAVGGVLSWFIGIFSLVFVNNFLNILSSNSRQVFYVLAAGIISLASLYYFEFFDITLLTQSLFGALYTSPLWVILPLVLLMVSAFASFRYYRSNLYLDAGLSVKQEAAETEEYSWLNRYGVMGTFLKNDIRLIRRNKRSRSTVIMSGIFIFYGLLFFPGAIDMYDAPVWKIFAGIFVSGGFLFTFGQFVPSWDSSYFPLMMTQNIQYREYLNSKWWLMIIATLISFIIGTFYIYFGWEAYLAVVVGAIYNMGVNAHLVLWGGAYVKTPLDLTNNKNVMGDKKAYNMKTLLLSLPKLILPLILYAIGHYTISPEAGYFIVAAAGVLGFAFKNKVFGIIERIYKNEKYETIAAYKEKN